MNPKYRTLFNDNFTEEKYINLIDNITNYDNIINNNITTNNMHVFNSIRVKDILNNAMERVKNIDNQLPTIPLFLKIEIPGIKQLS